MDCIEHTQKGDKFGYGTTRVATMSHKLHCKVNGSKALASKFNVHKSTITDVLRGGSWVRCK